MTDYATRWGRDRTRTLKGHPEREQRRQRAAERLAVHVYDPERCKPGCPARPFRAPALGSPTVTVTPRAVAAGVELNAGPRERSQPAHPGRPGQ